MKKIWLAALALLLCAGCTAPAPVQTAAQSVAPAVTEEKTEETNVTYTQITQDEAKRMMAEDDGHLIVDVRRPDEFAAGHIPGAVNVVNEEIGSEPPAALPDKTQILLVYCRSGRRSKEAAEKLAALGYTNVYEFGGILTWDGDVVKDDAVQTTASARTTAAEPKLTMSVDGETVPVTWESSDSVEALKKLAAEKPLTVSMSPYGGFEQVGPLGTSLVRNDVQTTTQAGDIVLYAGDQIVVFYGSNSWAYTRLGRIDLSTDKLKELLGGDAVTLTLEMR